jgi:pyruvate/2-oxoglutarate dehydrogenase complex dihydrolipoamide dehydrogenase (E3) component
MGPYKRYDLIIIGGGSAGLVAAVASGSFGARTLLVEKARLGGECSWTGCVPSKTLISVANLVHKTERGFLGRSGTVDALNKENLDAVFGYVKGITEKASKRSKVKGLLEKYGVDIIYGSPAFLDRKSIQVDGKDYSAKRFILATGSSPAVPAIDGLEEGYLTNVSLWELEKVPPSLAIIGAGPIGAEMAQAFARMGSRVSLFEKSGGILSKDDRELSSMLEGFLSDEGIDLYLDHEIKRVRKYPGGWEVHAGDLKHNKDKLIKASHLLVASGRAANILGLGLEAAGVGHDGKNIFTDEFLRTTAKGIWAAGDCNGKYQFSHIAEVEAKAAVRNALFPLRSKVDYQGAPWTTFTEPELAHLGLTEEECIQRGLKHRVYRQSFGSDDRALTEDNAQGMVKIIVSGGARLLGCHILGPRAGEILNEIILAKRKNVRLYDIGLSIHVYPTLGMVLQRATDQWFAELVKRRPLGALINMLRKK